ncbi:hypothetical protein K503DRAFT_71310 [Rhizopogon vinicolor AM-OR11-026]|uniref:Uncharacterized protein n=1 Tax=Rhizopogon vinicolor AM-OR11-026 TaxID=1314800 RepID=A0A1B7N450_9AGAM|nr:hypothetical protein K503DRAFT_71310 [Rhizopogon vinicolor AM-OR11-026]
MYMRSKSHTINATSTVHRISSAIHHCDTPYQEPLGLLYPNKGYDSSRRHGALADYYHHDVCPRGCILPTRTVMQYEPPRTIYLGKCDVIVKQNTMFSSTCPYSTHLRLNPGLCNKCHNCNPHNKELCYVVHTKTRMESHNYDLPNVRTQTCLSGRRSVYLHQPLLRQTRS